MTYPSGGKTSEAPRPAPPVSGGAMIVFFAIAVAAYVVFAPCLENGWVNWDDDLNFVNNPNYRGLGPRQLAWMFTNTLSGPYQPLTWMTLGLDYVRGGMEPRGYHLTNVLLHAANAALFAWVACLMFSAPRLRSEQPLPPGEGFDASHRLAQPSGAGFTAIAFGLFAAVFWAFHPFRAEPVAWITERREVLCGFFTLLCVCRHLAGRARWQVTLAALAAMLAKGTAVVLPVLLILIDVYRAGPDNPRGLIGAVLCSARRNAAVLLLTLVFAGIAIFGQHGAGTLTPWTHMGLIDRLVLIGRSLGFYVTKTAWPVGLAPIYELPLNRALLLPQGVAGWVMFLVALAAAWMLRRRTLAPLCLLIAYVAMVLPVSGLVQFGSHNGADRYAYPIGWVLSLAVAACLAKLARVMPRDSICVGVALVAGLGAAVLLVPPCRRLQRIWHDSESLWTHQLSVYPDTALAHYNFGMFHLKGLSRGEIPATTGRDAFLKAEPHFRAAVAKFPHFALAHVALGETLRRTGRSREAIESYRAALARAPGNVPAIFRLGETLWEQGRRAEAIEQFRALLVHEKREQSYITLARALAADDQAEEAIEQLRTAVRNWPDSWAAATELSLLLSTHTSPRVRNGAEAVQRAERAWRLNPSRPPRLVRALAAAHAEAGDFDRAIAILLEVSRRTAPDEQGPIDVLIEQFQRREPLRDVPRYP